MAFPMVADVVLVMEAEAASALEEAAALALEALAADLALEADSVPGVEEISVVE